MKSRLQDNDIEIYLQIIISDRFLRTSKNKIYKCMTSVSKNVYTDKLDEIVNKYKNTCNRTKMIVTVKLNLGDLQKCHKKVLKICILQTLVFLQS